MAIHVFAEVTENERINNKPSYPCENDWWGRPFKSKLCILSKPLGLIGAAAVLSWIVMNAVFARNDYNRISNY